jgi:hypothetical protein
MLILADNYDQAIAEGMSAIGGPSDQSFLITHILNAKIHLRNAEVDPFAFIPPAVESNSFVIIAKIDYLRAHDERRSWRKLAREGLELYPDNKFMRLYVRCRRRYGRRRGTISGQSSLGPSNKHSRRNSEGDSGSA